MHRHICIMEIIARIKNDYKTKFGIPRQPGIVQGVVSKIVFEGKYRDREYIRGIEDFSHLWLIWGFSENDGRKVTPTVRPPKLGGNVRKGVFATRSPFRPNGLGLSSVKLIKVSGGNLLVSGADLMDNTPIYDIKPYLSYTDCHTDALGGFTEEADFRELEVKFAADISNLDKNFTENLTEILKTDPRPGYQKNEKIYSFEFSDYRIKFKVNGSVLFVVEIKKAV